MPEGDFGQLLTFADLNSDKFSDLVTLDHELSTVKVFAYSESEKQFNLWKSFRVDGCSKIYNIVVGRSPTLMRLFVTCQAGGETVVKIVDRLEERSSIGDDEFNFVTVRFQLPIEQDSQPFIADLNGDFLEDVLFTDTSSNNVMVALQTDVKDTPFVVTDFRSSMIVRDPNEGCISGDMAHKRLTIPHSVAMVDFDGDCLSDLFLTVQDVSSGRKYYEIYLRREFSETMPIG